MKIILLSINLLLISWLSQAQNADTILGIWEGESKESHIKIYKKGNLYYGKIHWMSRTQTPEGKALTDQNNPDKKLRSRPILGLEIISGLNYKSGKWVNGKLYTPKKGATVDCKFALISQDRLKLTASKGLFSKSQTWKRVK